MIYNKITSGDEDTDEGTRTASSKRNAVHGYADTQGSFAPEIEAAVDFNQKEPAHHH
jgi:hypothetical protein